MHQAAPSVLDRLEGAVYKYFHPDSKPSIVDAIIEDHKALKQLAKILKDEKEELSTKRLAFKLFRSLLKSHSDSEEDALYSISKHLRGLKTKTEEGFVEHDVANELLAKIKTPTARSNTTHWKAQVQVLAELVEHHLEEEEDDLLPAIRKKVNLKVQIRAGQRFISLRKKSQGKVTARNAGILDKKR